MTKAITLSKEQAIAIVRWNEAKSENWGCWGNYPSLPVGASYLQYDNTKCVIKLSGRLTLNDGENENFKYITSGGGNTPGVKNGEDYISFYSLKSWCLPEEVKSESDAYYARGNAAYNTALANFNLLPENIKADLLAITIEICGSNNRRKKTLNGYAYVNKEAIIPVMGELKNVIKIVDCIQFNHKYFSI